MPILSGDEAAVGMGALLSSFHRVESMPTPRLDVDAIRSNIMAAPLTTIAPIKAWLEGYIVVTQEKECDGEKSYRSICLGQAQLLLSQLSHLSKKAKELSVGKSIHFTMLPDDLKKIIKSMVFSMQNFFNKDDATIPRKAKTAFGLFCNNFKAREDQSDYQSIYFLEDLEKLFANMKAQYLFADEAEQEGEAVKFGVLHYSAPDYQQPSADDAGPVVAMKTLNYGMLQSYDYLAPLNVEKIYPLMVIYDRIRAERFATLKRFAIEVPGQIRIFRHDAKQVRQQLAEFFDALQSETAFSAWLRQKHNMEYFFDGKFGGNMDFQLSAIYHTLKTKIHDRVVDCYRQMSDDLTLEGDGSFTLCDYCKKISLMFSFYQATTDVKSQFASVIYAILNNSANVSYSETVVYMASPDIAIVREQKNLLLELAFTAEQLIDVAKKDSLTPQEITGFLNTIFTLQFLTNDQLKALLGTCRQYVTKITTKLLPENCQDRVYSYLQVLHKSIQEGGMDTGVAGDLLETANNMMKSIKPAVFLDDQGRLNLEMQDRAGDAAATNGAGTVPTSSL